MFREPTGGRGLRGPSGSSASRTRQGGRRFNPRPTDRATPRSRVVPLADRPPGAAITTVVQEPPPAPEKPGTRLLGLGLLLALALGLRLWPIEHGLPRNYVPDTHIVRNALGMAKDKNPVPEVGLYSTYPYLLPYVLLPIYAGEYALGRVQGEWAGAEEFGNRLLEEPWRAQLPARWLVALFGVATVWVVFRAGRAMGLGGGAWVAAPRAGRRLQPRDRPDNPRPRRAGRGSGT